MRALRGGGVTPTCYMLHLDLRLSFLFIAHRGSLCLFIEYCIRVQAICLGGTGLCIDVELCQDHLLQMKWISTASFRYVENDPVVTCQEHSYAVVRGLQFRSDTGYAMVRVQLTCRIHLTGRRGTLHRCPYRLGSKCDQARGPEAIVEAVNWSSK